jgi:hypothetical protein
VGNLFKVDIVTMFTLLAMSDDNDSDGYAKADVLEAVQASLRSRPRENPEFVDAVRACLQEHFDGDPTLAEDAEFIETVWDSMQCALDKHPEERRAVRPTGNAAAAAELRARESALRDHPSSIQYKAARRDGI